MFLRSAEHSSLPFLEPGNFSLGTLCLQVFFSDRPLVAISDIAHANDVITAALPISLTPLLGRTDGRRVIRSVGRAYGTRCVHLRRSGVGWENQ